MGPNLSRIRIAVLKLRWPHIRIFGGPPACSLDINVGELDVFDEVTRNPGKYGALSSAAR